MRLLIASALLAAALGAAGCVASPSTRVPEVVTARPIETAPATYAPTGTAGPAGELGDDSDKPAEAAREEEPDREVVAPHVDERDDEEAEDAAPEEEDK